jgi:hypothetical protein
MRERERERKRERERERAKEREGKIAFEVRQRPALKKELRGGWKQKKLRFFLPPAAYLTHLAERKTYLTHLAERNCNDTLILLNITWGQEREEESIT